MNNKVTIYTTSEFFGSVVKREGTLISHGRMKYAQYDNAPFVRFVPRGKRKEAGIVKGYRPYIVIVEGWEAPDPGGMFTEPVQENGFTVKKSRYSAFDDAYKTDFDAVLAKSNLKIIADYREKVSA